MEEDNNPIQEVGTKTKTSEGQVNSQNYAQANNGSKKINTQALISFIASILGLFVAGIPCGIVAIITGITALVKFNKETEKFKWMAIVGLIIGVADVALVTIGLIIKGMALSTMYQ